MATPNLLGIVVADMAAALRFYRLLGLDIPAAADSEQHVEVTLAGGFRLAWDTLDLVQSIDPQWQEPRGQRMGLAFLCQSAAEVDELYAQVIAAGYRSRTPPWDAFWGQRYAVVVDPDDNPIDLFAPLEKDDG
jgi:uncharacterized glyoxalase superfamily protein PhnB